MSPLLQSIAPYVQPNRTSFYLPTPPSRRGIVIRRGLRFFASLCLVPVLAAPAHDARQVKDEIRCTYSRRSACGPDGCKPIPIGTAYLLAPQLLDLQLAEAPRLPDEPVVAVRRCDGKGCTPIDVVSAPSGIFLNVWTADGGYMLKFVAEEVPLMDARRGDFVEVTTAMLTTIVSHGQCPFPPA